MKRIVIAGATGDIGKALTFEALKRWPEAKVWAIGRREEKLAKLKEESSSNDRLTTIQKDLDHYISDNRLGQQLQEEALSIDLAIYAIGILNADGIRPEKSLREVKAEPLLETFRVNAAGAMDFAQVIKPLMRHSSRSRFIAISAKVGSIGDNGLGGWYAYRMSKAALNMGMKNVAVEFLRSGCNSVVAAVHPGTTLTNFSKDYVEHWGKERVAEVELTAKRLLNLCETLEPKHNGSFLHWDGTPLPW